MDAKNYLPSIYMYTSEIMSANRRQFKVTKNNYHMTWFARSLNRSYHALHVLSILHPLLSFNIPYTAMYTWPWRNTGTRLTTQADTSSHCIVFPRMKINCICPALSGENMYMYIQFLNELTLNCFLFCFLNYLIVCLIRTWMYQNVFL